MQSLRLLAISLLSIALPAPIVAQELLCAWTNEAKNDEDGHIPALRWMNGIYTLVLVTTDDACRDDVPPLIPEGCSNQKDLILGLDKILVPFQAAYPSPGLFAGLFDRGGWIYTELGNLIRNGKDRGTMWIEWARPRRIGGRMDGDLLMDQTHVWCVSDEPGRMRLQASIARDLRWGPKSGFWGALSAIGDWLGISDSKVYYGPTPYGGSAKGRDHSWTIPTKLYTTWRFPTAEWQALDLGEARRFDHLFRTTLDPTYAQNFTTWELQLHGVLRREPATYQTCAKERFELFPPRTVCEMYRTVHTFRYTRTLGGEVRMTTYMSHRIGEEGFEPARFEYQFRVLFQAPDIFFPDSVTMEYIADQIAEEYCGSRDGCGSIPFTPAIGASNPFGLKMGTDSVSLTQDLCQGALRLGQAEWGLPAPIPDCMSAENNPLMPSTVPASEDLERDTTGPGVPHGDLPDTTEVAKTHSGVRVVNNDTLRLSNQQERRCLLTAQRDSTDIVNGPREVGEPPPRPVPVAVLYNICAARVGLPPRPDAETPVLDAQKCFHYAGATYCIR